MRLKVSRRYRYDTATIGKLLIDDSQFCWTLEDVVRPAGIKVPGATAIPPGVYRVQITYSPKFKQLMPMLVNVPGFSGIRIHAGNTDKDTAGCILVGHSRYGESIANSRRAYAEVYGYIQDALDIGQDVMIEVRNEFETEA